MAVYGHRSLKPTVVFGTAYPGGTSDSELGLQAQYVQLTLLLLSARPWLHRLRKKLSQKKREQAKKHKLATPGISRNGKRTVLGSQSADCWKDQS